MPGDFAVLSKSLSQVTLSWKVLEPGNFGAESFGAESFGAGRFWSREILEPENVVAGK